MGSIEKKIWIVLTVGVILLIGTTFAWFYWNSTTNTNVSLNVDGITVNYEGGTDITGVNLIPVSSKEKGVADNTAIEKVVTASCTTKLYLNLYLTLETLPDGLKDESFVYEIYKGANLVGSGNFKNYNQGDVVKLATHQEITSTESSFQIYIWIDGTKDNPDTMMNQTFKFVLSADGTTDSTVYPNEPKLVDGLIPVTYSNDKWVKADKTNADNDWYNYEEKKWANAVLVTNTNRSTYQRATAGTEIPESDVLAYYVWIPRYKYKVWNITKTVGTDSYNAQTTGIDIVFESGTESSGTITCNDYSFAAPTADTPNETCSGSNGEYYTHPAFTFGDTEVEGIWVGKFEISSSSPTTSYGGGISTSLTVRSKPNVNSWRYNYVTNFSYVIQNMSIENNEYGLKTDSNSHMLKNQEWGAVAYLTHSGYGRCSGDGCEEVAINSHYSGSGSSRLMYTGCGPQSKDSTSSGSTCNAYNTELGQLASTTGNIYGVYDMSGGAYEYVMGNMSSAAGSYTYYASSGGSNFIYSEDTAKYIDTYAYGRSEDDQTAYNRARLGDATGEVAKSSGYGWNNDYAYFVYSSDSWFLRGGSFSDGSDAGVFRFGRYTGSGDNIDSARACLVGGA